MDSTLHPDPGAVPSPGRTAGPKRNIRLDIEYDGQNYSGWQWQPHLPTLEGAIKTAIETMVDHPITLYSSGRTDAGVHAEQHVAHFFSHTTLPSRNLMHGLNSLLSSDVSIYHVQDMPLTWRARHDALEREYRYVLYNSPVAPALLRHYVYWVRDSLCIEAMQEAARAFIGEHDFSAFRSSQCDAPSPIRKLYEVSLHAHLPFIAINLRGTAFLRHQVRTIAGTLLQVGLGAIPPSAIPDILLSKNRRRAGPTLPAQGLTLVAVRYPDDPEELRSRPTLSRLFQNGYPIPPGSSLYIK